MKENPLSHTDEKAYRIAYLVAGYIRKTLTEAEHDELDQWVEASDENMLLFEELTDEQHIEANLAWMEGVQTEQALARTAAVLKFAPVGQRKKRRFWTLGVAAVLLLALAGAYFLRPRPVPAPTEGQPLATTTGAQIADQPTLTLSDGSVINLGTRSNGVIRQNGNTRIDKKEEGLLMYQKLGDNREASYHTLAIPKGTQYSLQLADGSRVWLNALSTMRFPEQFGGDERLLELRGEAYFEVAKDAKHPFIVRLPNGTSVRVLGTSFNVLCYNDEEAQKITLAEGRVEVHAKDQQLTLNRGQQAVVQEGKIDLEHHADIEAARGWKEGEFIFHDADIYSIMRQAARWYDVQVIYRTPISEHFNLSISRSEPLSKILNLLSLTGKIHFKQENKTIYVLP